MKRSYGVTLKDAIGDFMKSYHLDEKLQQKQVILSWGKVMGKLVSKHTVSLMIRKRVLYVRLDSAALKTELSFSREQIRKALNKEVRAEVITDVIIH